MAVGPMIVRAMSSNHLANDHAKMRLLTSGSNSNYPVGPIGLGPIGLGPIGLTTLIPTMGRMVATWSCLLYCFPPPLVQ